MVEIEMQLVNFHVPSSFNNMLRNRAKKLGIAKAELMRLAIIEGIDEAEKKVEADKKRKWLL